MLAMDGGFVHVGQGTCFPGPGCQEEEADGCDRPHADYFESISAFTWMDS